MSRSRKGPLILRKRFSALRSRRIRRTSCSNRSATTASTRPRRRSPWRRCSVWVVSNRPEPPGGESGWFAALFVGTTSASGMPPCRRSRGGVIAQRYRCSVPIGRARNGSASTSRKWSAVWTSDSRCRCARSAGGNGRRLAPGRLTTESPPMRSRPIFVPGGTGSPSGPAKRSKMSKGPFRRFVAAAPRVAATDVAGIEDDEGRFSGYGRLRTECDPPEAARKPRRPDIERLDYAEPGLVASAVADAVCAERCRRTPAPRVRAVLAKSVSENGLRLDDLEPRVRSGVQAALDKREGA